MSGLDYERAVLSGGPIGIMSACWDIVLPYIVDRKQFGQSIGSFQLMQGKIADMYTWVESIRSLVYCVLSQCDSIDKSQAGKGEIHMNTSASVMFASTTSNNVISLIF